MIVTTQKFRLLWGSLLILPLIYLYWPRNVSHLLHVRSWRHASGPIANDTAGFAKILIINRPARTDRRDAMALVAAVSNLTLEWVDGVDGDTVEERVLPPGDRPKQKSSDAAVRGSWRAHMNALRRVVEEGLPNALILEDDVDWDLRIKSQLQTFGAASNAWLHKTSGLDEDPLITYRPRGSGAKARRTTGAVDRDDAMRHSVLVDHISPVGALNSPDYPYGIGWDVLWLGHCGTDFPSSTSPMPQLRVVVADDPTVPAPQHLKPHPFASHDALGELYPPHTRVVHAASFPGTACTLAYAVSQRGARKLLWQFGLDDFSGQWDLMLGDWCAGGYVERTTNKNSDTIRTKGDREDNEAATAATGASIRIPDEVYGKDSGDDGAKGRGRERRRRPRQQPTCLTVQPPIFGHYFAKKGASDIRGQGRRLRRQSWHTLCALERADESRRFDGGGTAEDVVDQLPDEGEAMW
ncbi:glycosyltransferase family 25 protein [Apiospora rasikravindrae]|uniref:Glycosyltransferase family 25 protein n=1 Tax=Apiospora rasikravindrae TaxID=990691 RepID=A0ABR1TBP4_9PEZI